MDGGNNPVGYFRKVFAPIDFFEATLEYFLRLVSALVNFLRVVWSSLPYLVLFGLFWGLTLLYFGYGFSLLERAENIWRCDLQPLYPEFFRPFFAALVEWWKTGICWWNLVGDTQRLLGGKLVWGTLMKCDNGFRFWTYLTAWVESFVALVRATFLWFFTGNSLDSAIPLYPWFYSTSVIVEGTGQLISCLCEDLRIFVLLFSRVATTKELPCLLNQLTNALLAVLQTIVRFCVDFISLAFNMAVVHPGDFDYLFSVLSGEIPGFTMPSMVPATERTAVAAYYAGQALNSALQILICTGISEIEAEGDVSLTEPLYDACMADNSTRADLFCWTGPVVGTFYRFERAIFAAIINLPRILWELFARPPGNRYLTDDWIVDQVYDTLRFPPPLYNYSASVNFPTLIAGSNSSAITPLKPELYGNYTDPANVNCSDYNVSRFIVPCADCPEVESYDLELCVCNTARDLDNLIVGLLDFKIFDGTLCCVAGKILRIMVALVKFGQGLVSHIIVIDRFYLFVTDQNNWDIPIDELVGPYYQIGGLLSCCSRILKGFDERLECLCTIVVTLVKAAAEIFRLLLDAVVRALNDLFNTGEIGFFDVVCTTKASCFDLELRVFQYLRRTRPNVYNGTDPNFLDYEYPINTTLAPVFIDCFCEFLSFRFLNQFTDDPSDPTELPDFCCAINYAFRFLTEVVKFAVELLFSVFETVNTFFDPDVPVSLEFLGYVACETVDSCAPIAQMLADVLDFLQCPCTLVQSINDIINPTKETIRCACMFFDSVAYVVYYLLRAIFLAAQTVVQLLACVEQGFPEGPNCGMVPPDCVGSECDSRLKERVQFVFGNLNNATDSLADTVGTFGCVLGLLFRFDCMGTRYFSPADYPTCSQGSSYGICAMGDRLTRFFRDTFLVIIVIPKFVLGIFEQFALIAFNVVFTGFNGFADLVEKFLLAVGEPFFGKADPMNPTTGWVQSLCLLLNCLIGPPTDECINELSPALDANASGSCIGDILCVVGNAIRDIYGALVNLLSSFIGIIEALFAGNGTLLADRIVEFIKAFFNVIAIVLGSASQLLEVIKATIVGIATAIIGPGFGALINFALTIALGVAQILLEIIGNLVSLFVGMKRGLDYYYGIDGRGIPSDLYVDLENIEELYKSYARSQAEHGGDYSKENPFWKSSNDDIEDPPWWFWDLLSGNLDPLSFKRPSFFSHESAAFFQARHFKFAFGFADDDSSPGNGQKRAMPYLYDPERMVEDLIHKRAEEARKRGVSREEEIGASRVTYEELSNMDFARRTSSVANGLKDGTYCKMAMGQFSSARNFDDLSLPEILIWEGCYVAYAAPVRMNEVYEENTSSSASSKRGGRKSSNKKGKRDEADDANVPEDSVDPLTGSSYVGVQVPEDFMSDPETFLSTVSDGIKVMKEYVAWTSQMNVLYPYSSQNFVDYVDMPAWFWEYEKEIAGLARKKRWDVFGGNETEGKVYVYSPKRSPNPKLYVKDPDETWERITDEMLFISLPGDQLSVPVINGRYPVYKRNVTFGEHLSQKGIGGKFVNSLVSSLSNEAKKGTENLSLGLFSVFANAEKSFRESQENSTDSYGNYQDWRKDYEYPSRSSNETSFSPTPSLFGVHPSVWEKFFQLNPRRRPPSFVFKNQKQQQQQQQQQQQKRTEFTVEDAVLFSAIDAVSNLHDGMTAIKKALGAVFYGRSEEQSGGRPFPFGKKRKFVPEWEEDVMRRKAMEFEAARERIGLFAKTDLSKRAKSFNAKRYFTEVVPQAISFSYKRLIGEDDADSVSFESYVRRKRPDLILSMEKREEEEEFSYDPNVVYSTGKNAKIMARKRAMFNHTTGDALVDSLNDEKYFYLKGGFASVGDSKRRVGGGPFPGFSRNEKRRTFFSKISGNGHLSTDDLENEETYDLLDEHFEALGNMSLLGHRVSMVKTLFWNVYRKAARAFDSGILSERFKAVYWGKYAKAYSDTIRKHKRNPTVYQLYSLGKSLMTNGGKGKEFYESKNVDGVFSEKTELWKFVTRGSAEYDGDEKYKRSPDDFVSVTKRAHNKKRSLAPILVPICLPGNDELTCGTCYGCPEEKCSNCKSCRNCTFDVVANVTNCERCASCSVGGPGCKQGCIGCEECDVVGVCLNCAIIEEFISAVYYHMQNCVAYAEGDTSWIVKLPPNTTFVRILYRNETDPPVYDDPILDFLFNKLIPKFTNVDIGATAVDFADEDNLWPGYGSVGLEFFLLQRTPIPFIRECNWDIEVQCAFGQGLEEGLKIAIIIVFVLAVVVPLVLPPLGTIIANLVEITVGWTALFFIITASFAWFYDFYCFTSPTTIVYNYLAPSWFPPILPMLPICAPEQLLALLDKYVTACYSIFLEMFFGPLLGMGRFSECPTCPYTYNISNVCPEVGFFTQYTSVGYYIQRYWPNGNDYLNQTCLVKGKCLFGLGPDQGPLYPFFEHRFNITYDSNGTATNSTIMLDVCGASFVWTSVVSFLFFLFLAAFFLPFFMDVLMATYFYLLRLATIPPFSRLVTWPFSYLVPSDQFQQQQQGRGQSASSSASGSSRAGGGGGSKRSASDKRGKKGSSSKKDKKTKKNKKGKKAKPVGESAANYVVNTPAGPFLRRRKSKRGFADLASEGDFFLESDPLSPSSSSSSSSSSDGEYALYRKIERLEKARRLEKFRENALSRHEERERNSGYIRHVWNAISDVVLGLIGMKRG